MWSYDFAANPTVANVRLIIGDRNPAKPIFSDEEIEAFYRIQASTFQSGMWYSFAQGRTLPASPVSILRVAALALDSLANQRARLATVTQILDVRVAPGIASKALHDQAECLREVEDNAGAIAIFEQCTSGFGYIQRWLKQAQRITIGSL